MIALTTNQTYVLNYIQETFSEYRALWIDDDKYVCGDYLLELETAVALLKALGLKFTLKVWEIADEEWYNHEFNGSTKNFQELAPHLVLNSQKEYN